MVNALDKEQDGTVYCTVHNLPAQFSYCGGFWFCRALANEEDPLDRWCEVPDDAEPEDYPYGE